MKRVLLTGASKGIGLSILVNLLERNDVSIIVAIGRNFEQLKKYMLEHPNLNLKYNNKVVEKICDLSDLQSLERTLKDLKKYNFNILINSAGLAHFGLHEEMNIGKIKSMLAVNLQAPLIICQYFLRDIKKNEGHIINISSKTASETSPKGLVYSSTKAGLSHFSKGLFEEVRKYNVKVTCIEPDMTDTNFYDKQNFMCNYEMEKSYIKAEQIGEIINFILDMKNNIGYNYIKIKPQIFSIKKK